MLTDELLRHHPARQALLLQEDEAFHQGLNPVAAERLPGPLFGLHRHVIGKLVQGLVEAGIF